MRYAQIKAGNKLHIVYEAGEGRDPQHLIPAGQISLPLCGQHVEKYRMSINVPLGHCCIRCVRVYNARNRKGV